MSGIVRIDCMIHRLTGAQILYRLIPVWRKQDAALLTIQRGTRENKMNAIRIALSRERKAHGVGRTFELRFSDPVNCKSQWGGLLDFVVIVKVRGGKGTKLTAALHEIFTRAEKVQARVNADANGG